MPTTIETGPDGVFAACSCGWSGEVAAVSDWHVDRDRDRLVRRCPACATPRPEWGTVGPLAGVERVARGEVRAALVAAGVVDD